jgi:predicted O-methyltransferase YrrM
MERTLYGISSVQQPPNIVAIGIFCGNTFVWNVGSACGPGKCYTAKHLLGTDIDVDAIKLARSNFTKLGAIRDVDILTEDGHTLLDRIDYPIDLLYLDANGPLPGTTGPGTKKIYLTLLQRAYSKIPRGGLVVAHDTTPDWFVRDAGCYLDYVRDSANFRLSVSIEPDDQGVEISVK